MRIFPPSTGSLAPGRSGLAALLALLVIAGCATKSVPRNLPALTDLDGRTHSPELPPGTKAAVYLFLGVECPIANRALPEIAALENQLGPRGVAFFHLYPNPDETPEIIRRHRADFQLRPEAYLDPELRVARMLHARWTPEAVALTPDGQLIYQGRINDQFTALGVSRLEAAHHDLAEALEAYLDGAPPAGRITPGVGCTFRPAP